MLRYGAYQAHPPEGDITWFTTEIDLVAGNYIHGHGSEANVFLDDSIPALIMRVYPEISTLEQAAQSELAASDMNVADREDMADRLTDGLVQRLTSDDSIWGKAPHWLHCVQLADGDA